MGAAWVGEGTCMNRDGEVQVGIQPPLEELFLSPDLLENKAFTDPFALQINWMDQDHNEKYPHPHPEGDFQHKRLYMTHKL